MISASTKAIIGFLLLFVLYHAAEYFVLFTYSPIGFLSFQLLFFIVAWFLAKWQGYRGLSAWGMDVKKGWLANLLLGMGMGLLLYGGVFALSIWLKSEEVVEVPAFSAIWPQLALFSFGVFFSSFSEDVLTRGYVYKHIGSKISPAVFILVSSIIYLLNHIYRLNDGVETLLYIFLLGVLLAIPILFTKRLWLTGGMHWVGNTVFFYTHSVIKVEEVLGGPSPNTLFIICILLFTPITLLLVRSFKTSLDTSSSNTQHDISPSPAL